MTGGFEPTVNSEGKYNPFLTVECASYRQIVDMKEPSNGHYIIPMGQSENAISSANFENFFDMWANGQTITFQEKFVSQQQLEPQ